MYYTVRQISSDRQCISTAVSSNPAGPFVDNSSAPFICQLNLGGSIDPQPFVDTNGTAYLLWKSDNNALGQQTSLWSQKLSTDGLSLVNSPVKILSQTQPWQAPIIEGPSMVKSGSTYYLFYGANNWDTSSAAMGYATCSSPITSCTNKSRSGPWVGTHGNAAGPAGPATFTDNTGVLRFAYHAWNPTAVGYNNGGSRTMWIDTLVFNSGVPTLR